jgi:hypothetical protein
MANFLEEVKMVEVINTGLTYYGYAWPGVSTSDKKWKISRKVSTSTTSYKLEYALPPRGYNTVTDYFIFSWDDRASLPDWG